MWWFAERHIVLFLSTILCSSLVWGVQNFTRAQDCPSLLEGIPDQKLITGKLFVYRIPETVLKCKKNCSIEVTAASQNQTLPQWITYEEITRRLIAVPTMHDGFGLYIKITLSDQTKKCQIISDIFYLEVKPYYMSYEHRNRHKPEKTCYKGINLIQTTLIFAVNLYKLDALARYNIMKNLADFLDINETLITITASKELFSMQDKSQSFSILASGRGNTDAVLPNVTELTWRVPCGVFKEVSLYMQVLQHNVEGGRLTREVGYDVVGWYISALVNPSKQHRSRKKRAIPKNSTPTPTPQIEVVPATKIVKSSSSLYSASLKTELLKSSQKLESKDHMTDKIIPTKESSLVFVSSRESVIEVEPTKSFTAPAHSESLFEKLKTVSADKLHPTPSVIYSEYIPKRTVQPDRHTTNVKWHESSRYHTGVYEISGSGDVSRFSEFTTEEPITPPTSLGKDITKPPMTPLIAATPTLATDTDGDEDSGTDLDYYGSGSGSGSGDEEIDEDEDTTSEITLKPSESSIIGGSTPVVKTLYVDQTDTNTFYFEESEITIRNIPQSTTYEETVTPTLSTVSPVIWPSGMVPIDLLTSIELPLVTMSSSHKPSQSSRDSSSSVPVRPSPTHILSGHSYIDSQIGGHSSVSLQPSGSKSGHSEVDSRIDGRSSSVHVEPSQSRSGHSYVDIKPVHSSGQSHIIHQPSLKVNETSIGLKPSHISNHSSLYSQPFPTLDGSSSTVFKPFSSVDQSSVHLKFPVSSVIHSHISQSQSYKINKSRSQIPSSSSFHPSTGHESSERHEHSSVPLKHSVDQSYHRSDHPMSIKPSLSMTYSSLHVRPSHGRVETSSEIKPSTKSVDLLSTGVKPSHKRVDRSSEQIRPTSSSSFYPKPSRTHTFDHMYTDLRPSSHRSDYSTLMPGSSESRLPIASRDISSHRQNLTSMLHRLSSQRQDMISSSSPILLPSRSSERHQPSSSSMTHHVLKTKDVDSVLESTRLYSTPVVVFPTTAGVGKSKDYDFTAVPERPKPSSTSCVSGYGCKTRESATRTSSQFPVEHTKTVDSYTTTEKTDSNWVPTEDYFVTKQIPKWYTQEFTPEMTTARTRKTTKKKQRKPGQEYDKKPKHTNMAPDVINPIGKIYAFAGKNFEFKIPENTFNDLEDGSTKDLTLDIAFRWDSYKPPTYSQSWVQFDEAKQTFSGLPLPRDVKDSPVEITINAIDQGGKIAQDIILIYINYTDTDSLPTQEFIMRFDVNGRRFLNDRRKFKNLIKKLSGYFGDKDSNYITVLDARPGSLIVTWTNNSIPTDRCDNATIHEVKQKVVDYRGYINPKFSKYMSPKYKVTSVEFQMKGACQDVSEPSEAGGMVDVDPWAEAIIPTVIAVAIAIFIVVIILLICSRKQNKEKSKPKEQRHSFEDQDPVMFHREQAQKDKAIRSKRAVILPGDGKPKSSGRRKFSPQIGLPYQPSTFDEQEYPSDEDIYGNENATYGNTYSQPPPPYRLPPPYHVDNGSSYV
ncbi:uncharacterized protein LOC115230617 [Octopus sinensis]|uniref:Uncharacterized protein LOC115230617 n=1 Tax=Octopus sinensis TaxID=2607531 RepID=A0A6P7U6K8_9MOLL|nr:uncharacterized protein LOC115230617 [Octopus sinensis]